MAIVPDTSATLLNDLAGDAQHARWGEFVARYRPMMEAYVRERFPEVEVDEVVQETFIAFIRIFPVYHYVPDEKGSFHNYLTGVLRHKALRMARHAAKRFDFRDDFSEDTSAASVASESDERLWRESIFEIALQQFLADDSVQERTKQIFTRVAVNGEKPEVVAAAFGIKRNAVDQIKNRTLARLKKMIRELESVG